MEYKKAANNHKVFIFMLQSATQIKQCSPSCKFRLVHPRHNISAEVTCAYRASLVQFFSLPSVSHHRVSSCRQHSQLRAFRVAQLVNSVLSSYFLIQASSFHCLGKSSQHFHEPCDEDCAFLKGEIQKLLDEWFLIEKIALLIL